MKHRQYLTYIITLVFAGLFSCANPASTPTSDYTVTLTGTLVNLLGTKLDSVHIVLWSPFQQDTGKSNGTFSISFVSQSKNTVNDSIYFSRSGFVGLTKYFSFNSGAAAIDFSAIVMKGITSAQDSLTQSRPSLRAGQIVYVGASAPSLSIYGAGGTDAVALTFQVKDSVGNPVDSTNQTLVRFRFATTPPDTFTQLSVSSAKTNSSGLVSVLLGSGLRAGIASVQAYAAVKRASDTTKVDTILSSVVSIPIFGGFPDSAHFSMSASRVNIPGGVQAGIQTPITALIGDKYGNPAQPGTIVYFTANGGLVSPAYASSAADGSASVNLVSGNPIPPGGVVTITAQLTTAGSSAIQAATSAKMTGVVKSLNDGGSTTVNHPSISKKANRLSKAEQVFKNKRTVVKFVEDMKKVVHTVVQNHSGASDAEAVAVNSSKNNRKLSTTRMSANDGAVASSTSDAGVFSSSIDVIFSGNPLIAVADTTLNIYTKGQKQVSFTVADKYGNPLSGGSEIKVTASGSGASQVTLTGDIDRILPDTKDKAFTSFTVYAKDTSSAGLLQSQNFSLTILVTSPNGNVGRTLNGTVFPSGVSDTTNVGKLVLIGASTDSLTVTGGGGISSEIVQFQVLNVNGNPIQNVPVQFAITQAVGGGEYFNPTVGTSDATGKVQTTLFAGIRSGMVQIVAKAKQDTSGVVSNAKAVYIRTGIISSIAIINVSSTNLSVQGVGGNSTATIVFEGRDSLGNPIDASNSTPIKFTLQGDTTSRVSPLVSKSDPVTGRVTTSFTTGIKSGLGYVTASARNDSVQSTPVQFTISGGYPDSLHFSIGPQKLNIPGAAVYGVTDNISLVVGDKYGNPAQTGSVIYFSSTGGVMQSSTPTNADGTASATLTSGNPIPPNGFAVITAQVGASPAGVQSSPRKGRPGKTTQAVGGTLDGLSGAPSFTRSTLVLFSGFTTISSPDTNFSIVAGASQDVRYFVGDAKGNPLSGGSIIKVSASGPGSQDVEVSGDVDNTLADVVSSAYTHFKVSIRDKRTGDLSQTEALILKIDVTSANFNSSYSFLGRLLGSGVSDTNKVSSVSFIGSTNDTIAVAGAGGVSTDTLSFIVRDNNKLPVKNVAVQFLFSVGLNASEYITPAYVLTDSNGIARTVVNSGVRSGLMKVAAKVLVGSATISSADVPVYVKTGPMASIALISIDNKELSVKGVGGTENALITFEPRDALGNPIDVANQTQIFFTILGGPGSGEIVSPTSRTTDPFTGRVTTTLTSGTKATVLQVIAQNAGATIQSSPVPIVIHAGFADQAHFTVKVDLNSPTNVSFVTPPPQGVFIDVIAGDKYSNPVNLGTAIYFSSTGGVIGAQGYTDANGNVVQKLQIGNPIPASGRIWVSARTVGQGGSQVLDSTSIVVSGIPIISLVGVADTVRVFDGAFVDIAYTVQDRNGNPISLGNLVTVGVSGQAAGDITLSGDFSAATTRTGYSFRATDKIPNGGTHGDITFTITVKGDAAPNGVSVVFPGLLYGPGDIVVAPSARQPAQIAFKNITTNDIFVAGVGATENSVISYQVLDSLGQAIDKAHRAYATFGLQFFPNNLAGGGSVPTLIPSADSSDDSGQLRVSVQSGTEAGVVQVIAQIQSGPRYVVSQPVRITVHAGFADQKHFTLAAEQINFPGLDKYFVQDILTVQVVDKYSNPVQAGTAVYFNTANGSVQTGGGTSGLTDGNGFINQILFSSNPLPLGANVLPGLTNGFSRAYASTIGKDSTRVTDSLLILWSGAPIITKTGGPANYTLDHNAVPSAGPFTFTVADRLGHPMSAGTQIIVDAAACTVTGNANITMSDTQNSGNGFTDFSITISDALTATPASPVASILTVTVQHPVYGTFKYVLATGSVTY